MRAHSFGDSPDGLGRPHIDRDLAESFARIFYRNAVNVGLVIVEIPGITDRVSDGDEVAVDVAAGTVTNHTTGETFETSPLPEDLLEILEAGGLVEHTKARNG